VQGEVAVSTDSDGDRRLSDNDDVDTLTSSKKSKARASGQRGPKRLQRDRERAAARHGEATITDEGRDRIRTEAAS